MNLCKFQANECLVCKRVTNRPDALRNCCGFPGCLTENMTAEEWNQSIATPPDGPGTHLKRLLSLIGLHASADCKCTSRAAYMDAMEHQQPGWCSQNFEEIVSWMREAAHERGVVFIPLAARLLVRKAIAMHRAKASG